MERRGGRRKRMSCSHERDWIRGSCGRRRYRPSRGRAVPRPGDALRGGWTAAAGPSGSAAGSGAGSGADRGFIRAPRGGRGPIRVPAMLSGRGGRGWSGRRGSLAAGAGRPCPPPAPGAARPPLGVPGASPAHRPGAAASPGPAWAAASQASGASRAAGGAGCGVLGPAPGPQGCVGNAERPEGRLRGVRGPRGVRGSGVARLPPSGVFIVFVETDSCERSASGIRFRCFYLLNLCYVS